MVINWDLDESDMVIEPLNSREWEKVYMHFMKNAQRVNGSIDYRILEIGVFGVTIEVIVIRVIFLFFLHVLSQEMPRN